ncbi:MAG: radical SAM protein [Theionarchaea archaeon]|nr:radical SAM protein [Theionarchaea archaeon]MBU7022490.1 radical SAM protein [Theionarchaea archaeon]
MASERPDLPERPLQITFDITYRCNANCIHCYANASPKGVELDEKTTLKIVDKIIEARPLILILSGGEPILRPDIEDILLHLYHKMGTAMPQIAMGTNGQALSTKESLLKVIKDINDSIGAPAVGIYVSIHAADPQLHDHIMGVKGALERAVHAIDLIQSYKIPLGIGVTPMQVNVKYLDGILDFALSKGITVMNLSQFVPTGKGLKRYDLSPQQYADLVKWYVSKKKEYKGRIGITTHMHYLGLLEEHLLAYKYFYGCAEGWFHLAIKANGDVTLCPLMDVAIDTLLGKKGILDIWQNNPVLSQVRKREEFPVCGECALVWKCGGCRCVAYAYTGSVTGEDVMCPLHNKVER